MAAKISAHDKPPDTQSNLNKIKKISNSIFLSPCTPQEVFNLITKLKDRKARRTIDIGTRFIKLANPVISTFLSNLFNVCLNTGVYLDSLKIAEVIPIVVGSVVEWLKHRTDDQHGLGSKPTCAILLCPWERHFTALSPAWWS